jgi:simple sugar transport system ATP-binding protein
MRLQEYDKKIADLGDQFGLKVDPRAKIWQLSVGEQQRVELLKMLYRRNYIWMSARPSPTRSMDSSIRCAQ